MKKKLWTKIITCVLLVATLLSIAIIPAMAAPTYPDGNTLYFDSYNPALVQNNMSIHKVPFHTYPAL